MVSRVIITGADGFVGSHVTECFLKHGVEVLAVGRRARPQRLQKHVLMKYVQADLFNINEFQKKVLDKNYDVMLHFAWDGSSGDRRGDCNLQLENAKVASELVHFAKKIGCSRFIGAGSIMEYEVEKAIASSDIVMNQNFYYNMGKLLAHIMCKIEAEKCGIELVWGIITNAYGEGEFSPRFINSTIKKMLGGKELEFTSATQNYDFIYVDDLAEAFYAITVLGKPGENYLLGSGEAKPLKEFIYQIRKIVNSESVLKFGGAGKVGINLPIEFYSIDKLVADTGFKSEVDFEEGIRKTMKWMSKYVISDDMG